MVPCSAQSSPAFTMLDWPPLRTATESSWYTPLRSWPLFGPLQHRAPWIEQCFTSPPTQYRLYGRRFIQVKRPNQQYQSTEGTNSTQTNQTYNKQTGTQNTASPLVYNNMGWLGDGSDTTQHNSAVSHVGTLGLNLSLSYLLIETGIPDGRINL